jgi:hypothetical protein
MTGTVRYRDLTPEKAFWSKVNKTAGCWLWTRPGWIDGYAQFMTRRRRVYVHRFAYELTHGPIPPGLLVCHKCDVPLCVRPDHLFLGTPKDNILDAVRKGRLHCQKITHCPHGHEYTPENTYQNNHNNSRHCRECRRIEWRRARAKRQTGIAV